MSISVWGFGPDANNDLSLQVDSGVEGTKYFNTHFIAKSMREDWNAPTLRILDKSRRLRDFVSMSLSAPVISEKAKQALESLIGSHCEILPLIELRNKVYYAVNVLTVVDCLNHKWSKISYSPSDPGRILSISSYIFDVKKIPSDVPIFKIPEDMYSVFVTKLFVDAVIANGLRGACFDDPTISPFIKIGAGEPLNVVSGLPE